MAARSVSRHRKRCLSTPGGPSGSPFFSRLRRLTWSRISTTLPNPLHAPQVATAADEAKLERRRKKEEKAAQLAYESHVAEMNSVHLSAVRARSAD